jgi:hypothetical protein
MAQYVYVVDTGITTTRLFGVDYPGGISVGQTTYDLMVSERYIHGIIPVENTTGFWFSTNDNTGIYTTRNVGIGTTVPTSQLTVTGSGTTTSQLYVAGVSTFVGISTVQSTLFSNQLSVSGFSTSTAYAVSGTSSSTDTSTSTLTVDASTTQMYSHIASFNGDRTFQVSNLTNGRYVYLYIRNTDSINSRTITIQASTTTSGYSSINMSRSGSSSVSSFTASSGNGTAVVWVANINGNLIGSLS